MGMIRAACLFLALPALAGAEPGYFRVTGVAQDDVLNLRAAPSAQAEDLGDLDPDTRHVEVIGFDDSGDWARIARGERDLWAAARFLVPDQPDTLETSSLPDGLSCSGTEPFWSLTLSSSAARFDAPGSPPLALDISDVTIAEGRIGSPARVTLTGTDARAEAHVFGALCSDGMSDRSYGWTALVGLQHGAERRLLSGCCTFLPD
ncbi:peptide-binding protein [Marivita sp. GX14005]|uniref:COG3650 family protein n=1 Tax=Marivita sp. GX14005 TaxID=2942276 RepID=UPI002019DA7B|nr:peptide-binding protein [Marivita sp. GX14005]MCL3883640.1 peptide-binding protein [Marivita sp. GX14005]